MTYRAPPTKFYDLAQEELERRLDQLVIQTLCQRFDPRNAVPTFADLEHMTMKGNA